MPLLKFQRVESTIVAPRKHYGKFIFNGLETGQALTVGNALRRVLLSEIDGLSIVAARVGGVSHEFSTLEGVKEDVIEILMNLKSIVLQGDLDQPQKGRLLVQGPKQVTSEDLDLPPNIQPVDKTQYIASISTPIYLDIEFYIEKGCFSSFKENDQSNYSSLGFLNIDAVSLPVRKVNFTCDEVQLNLSQVVEQLTMEVWTNGSIEPYEALSKATYQLTQLFSLIKVSMGNTTEVISGEISDSSDLALPSSDSTDTDNIRKETILIEELRLSVRAYNCLKRAQINSLDDLLKYSEEQLLEIKNFGQKSATEVITALKKQFDLDLQRL
jgi:DNA-directed RNA polymerase subunit alpha